jgi:SAM-dependent methyltransferase
MSNDHQRSDHPAEQGATETGRFWDDFYRRREQVWSGNANAALVDTVAGLPPGTALDLGCGEGGDAIWLAQTGWRVTAVDVSLTALDRVAARAAEAGVADRITGARHDLASTFPVGRFDLVSAQFLQSPLDFPRAHILQEAARAVAPGGLLLIVEHGSIAPRSGNQDADRRFPTLDETLASLDLDLAEWETVRLAAPVRKAHDHGGQTITITDNIIALRRLTA